MDDAFRKQTINGAQTETKLPVTIIENALKLTCIAWTLNSGKSNSQIQSNHFKRYSDKRRKRRTEHPKWVLVTDRSYCYFKYIFHVHSNFRYPARIIRHRICQPNMKFFQCCNNVILIRIRTMAKQRVFFFSVNFISFTSEKRKKKHTHTNEPGTDNELAMLHMLNEYVPNCIVYTNGSIEKSFILQNIVCWICLRIYSCCCCFFVCSVVSNSALTLF